MEQILLGDLVCLRVPYSRTLRSLVERKVSEWAKSQFERGYPKGVHYEVTLERVRFDPSYRCQVQVRNKSSGWSAEEWGATPEVALSQALIHMKRVEEGARGLNAAIRGLPSKAPAAAYA